MEMSTDQKLESLENMILKFLAELNWKEEGLEAILKIGNLFSLSISFLMANNPQERGNYNLVLTEFKKELVKHKRILDEENNKQTKGV